MNISHTVPVVFAPDFIFRAYDIRGVAGETLTADSLRTIGLALGQWTLLSPKKRACDQAVCVVGRDGRLSGEYLLSALIEGLRYAGVDVVDIGIVTTPMVYFASREWGADCAICVTGSHNPPDHNGLKIVLNGQALFGEAIFALGARVRELGPRAADNAAATRRGKFKQQEIRGEYLSRITGDIRLARPVHVVLDCGNGVAGSIAPALFRALGCPVTELFCEVDGTFPNHHPDPALSENLQSLVEVVHSGEAELGFAFDGDGDRLGVVTKSGRIVEADALLMLLAQEVLSRKPGATVVFDVKCSRGLPEAIRKAGGVPLMCRTGHSFIKAKLRETGAALAGEMSGHFFFEDRWYGFDDGVYAAARLLETLSTTANPSAVLEALPRPVSSQELSIPVPEGCAAGLVESLKHSGCFDSADRVVTIDGVRAEYPGGFGLLRSSNTTSKLVARFEADSEALLVQIRSIFLQALRSVRPDLEFP